jgi:hypothetical protein
MCNLYSLTQGQQAILEFTRAMRDRTEALSLQSPLPDDALQIVARGERRDRQALTIDARLYPNISHARSDRRLILAEHRYT